MKDQILWIGSSWFKCLLMGFVVCQARLLFAADEVDFDKLVRIAERYDCPQPNETDDLIVGWDGSWRTIGQSNSRDAGIYRPGFVINGHSGKEVKVLMGFAKVTAKSRKTIPATRQFTLESPDERRDGFTILHNHLSSFETSVQLARMGKKDLANKLWVKFSASEYVDGGHAQEGVREMLPNPDLLLARSIFEYYKQKTLEPGCNWKDIANALDKLRSEFPTLFSAAKQDYNENYRNQFVEDLKLTVTAIEPMNGTVEERLLTWANTTGDMRHLGFYDSHNVQADQPVREIFLRGAEAIKPMVDLVGDRRLTLHVRPAVDNAREYRLRVGDLAEMLLREISGASSPVKNEWITQKPDIWLDWIANTDLTDETGFLESAAFDVRSGTTHEVPIRVMEHRHPERFIKLVETVSKNAKRYTYCHYVTDAIRDSSTISVAEKSRLLSMMSEQLPDQQKRTAVQALAYVNKDMTADLVLPLIKKIPKDVNEPYWTSEAAALTHVVMQLDDIKIWREYLQAAKNASVGLRMEMMEPMNYSYIGETNLDFRLAFLSSFLADETVRNQDADPQKYTGPCAAFTFKKISVRNYVAMTLASLILKTDDYPDDSWTPDKWEILRKEVQLQLAKRNLPDISPESIDK